MEKYLPSGGRSDPSKLTGMGGIYNSVTLNLYAYGAQNPIKYVDPDGNANKVASLVILVGKGVKEVGRLTKEGAILARRQGLDIKSDTKQLSKQIEVAANRGQGELRKDKGHLLKDRDGNPKLNEQGEQIKGAPHYHTEGIEGHNFWGQASSEAIDSIKNVYAGGFSLLADGLESLSKPLEGIGGALEKIEEKMPDTMGLLCAMDPTCGAQKMMDMEHPKPEDNMI